MKKMSEFLAEEDIVLSCAEGRRLVNQGAIRVDGEVLMEDEVDLDKKQTIKVGRRGTLEITAGNFKKWKEGNS